MKFVRTHLWIIGCLAAAAVIVIVAYFALHHPPQTGVPAAGPSKTMGTAENGTDMSKADVVAAPASKVLFSALPAELQAVIKGQVMKQAAPCIRDGQLLDFDGKPVDPEVTYAPIGSAIATIGCDGGAAGLFAKNKEAQWTYVNVSQNYFPCDDIFTNPVPKKLLEVAYQGPARCDDTRQNKLLTYDAALQQRYY